MGIWSKIFTCDYVCPTNHVSMPMMSYQYQAIGSYTEAFCPVIITLHVTVKYILLHYWEGNMEKYSARRWQYWSDRREEQCRTCFPILPDWVIMSNKAHVATTQPTRQLQILCVSVCALKKLGLCNYKLSRTTKRYSVAS